jgi:hypothetical protein
MKKIVNPSIHPGSKPGTANQIPMLSSGGERIYIVTDIGHGKTLKVKKKETDEVSRKTDVAKLHYIRPLSAKVQKQSQPFPVVYERPSKPEQFLKHGSRSGITDCTSGFRVPEFKEGPDFKLVREPLELKIPCGYKCHICTACMQGSAQLKGIVNHAPSADEFHYCDSHNFPSGATICL